MKYPIFTFCLLATLFFASSCVAGASGRVEDPGSLPAPLADKMETVELYLLLSDVNRNAFRSFEGAYLNEASMACMPAAFEYSRKDKTVNFSIDGDFRMRKVKSEELENGLFRYLVEVPALSRGGRLATRGSVTFSRKRLMSGETVVFQPVQYALQRMVEQFKKPSGHIRLVSIAYNSEDDSFTAQADLW